MFHFPQYRWASLDFGNSIDIQTVKLNEKFFWGHLYLFYSIIKPSIWINVKAFTKDCFGAKFGWNQLGVSVENKSIKKRQRDKDGHKCSLTRSFIRSKRFKKCMVFMSRVTIIWTGLLKTLDKYNVESFNFMGANFRGLWVFCLFLGMLFRRWVSFQFQ